MVSAVWLLMDAPWLLAPQRKSLEALSMYMRLLSPAEPSQRESVKPGGSQQFVGDTR